MHNKYALIKYSRNLTVKYLYKIKKSSMPFSFQFAKFKYFGLLEMCHENDVKVVIILDVSADQLFYKRNILGT